MGQSLPDPEWLDIGVRIRARRTGLGLSREDVAKPTRLSAKRIGAFERGTAAISAVELQRLAGLLKASIEAFLGAHRGPERSVRSEPTMYEVLASSDEGAALAEAFIQLQTPRLRRHLVHLAQELVVQESRLGR